MWRFIILTAEEEEPVAFYIPNSARTHGEHRHSLTIPTTFSTTSSTPGLLK